MVRPYVVCTVGQTMCSSESYIIAHKFKLKGYRGTKTEVYMRDCKNTQSGTFFLSHLLLMIAYFASLASCQVQANFPFPHWDIISWCGQLAQVKPQYESEQKFH